jgi:transcriptional repressor NrdR
MNCPFCAATDTRVINSRPSPNGDSVRRRRVCQECGKRFTTVEYIDKLEMTIIKRDDTREPFELGKVRMGIERACEKRRVSSEQIDDIVTAIERELLNRAEREIASDEIGRLCLRHLKELDHVAYLRFASVYKQFQDLQDFDAEIRTLLK